MSEPKWTAGPWRAGYNGACWQIDSDLHSIVTTQFCYAHETEANARLISAAPDLYEAVVALLPEGWGDDDTMDHIPGIKLARAALAKARGEP